jgi:hypothetical protein
VWPVAAAAVRHFEKFGNRVAHALDRRLGFRFDFRLPLANLHSYRRGGGVPRGNAASSATY